MRSILGGRGLATTTESQTYVLDTKRPLFAGRSGFIPQPKPKAPPLCCYIGIGIDRQPNSITGLVVRTNDPYLTAVFATACRLLGLHFPGNIPVEVTEERIDADPETQPVVEDLLARFSNMWVPWAEFAPPASGAATILDNLLL